MWGNAEYVAENDLPFDPIRISASENRRNVPIELDLGVLVRSNEAIGAHVEIKDQVDIGGYRSDLGS